MDPYDITQLRIHDTTTNHIIETLYSITGVVDVGGPMFAKLTHAVFGYHTVISKDIVVVVPNISADNFGDYAQRIKVVLGSHDITVTSPCVPEIEDIGSIRIIILPHAKLDIRAHPSNLTMRRKWMIKQGCEFGFQTSPFKSNHQILRYIADMYNEFPLEQRHCDDCIIYHPLSVELEQALFKRTFSTMNYMCTIYVSRFDDANMTKFMTQIRALAKRRGSSLLFGIGTKSQLDGQNVPRYVFAKFRFIVDPDWFRVRNQLCVKKPPEIISDPIADLRSVITLRLQTELTPELVPSLIPLIKTQPDVLAAVRHRLTACPPSELGSYLAALSKPE